MDHHRNSENDAKTLERHRKDRFFQTDESQSKNLGLPLFTKDLPDTRKYGDTIGSLHDFTSMTSLHIGVRLLLGPQIGHYSSTTDIYYLAAASAPSAPFRLIDALPPTLKYICIRGYAAGTDPAWDEQINELMQKKSREITSSKTSARYR